ncbi:MAG: hypothetical protein DRZ80_04710 [Thermoprotei archaeon]|nr:MAG: hypothetical protein DRZ80_04710 [Thermoprotei archaeon]
MKSTFGGISLFQARSWSKEGEGVHECIRPTLPITADMIIKMLQTGELIIPIKFTRKHFAIYQMIFKRFIASQMKENFSY